MVNGSDQQAARRAVRRVARDRDKLDTQYEKLDKRMSKAIGRAYHAGVSAIELAKITGLTRTNIYDRLKRVGVVDRQQPKKGKKKVTA